MIFTVFDTETTDLPRHPLAPFSIQPRIVEFAGIITNGREILSELEFMCNPGAPIAPGASKVSGITDEQVADKPDISEYFEELKNFFQPQTFGTLDGKFARVAHNLSFDRAMLEYDMKRRGKTLDDISFNENAIMVCTVEQTMFQFGRRMKLEQLWSRSRGEFTQKHRALDDVMRLHEVCIDYGIYEAIIGEQK